MGWTFYLIKRDSEGREKVFLGVFDAKRKVKRKVISLREILFIIYDDEDDESDEPGFKWSFYNSMIFISCPSFILES